ncbi:hypothetical protein [Pseudomonas aeruginosa]|uniref:hypothetical protein n=1 Tax=Pseudomonas aeruginosa TaxID=287 RepID=UPI0038909CE0
MSEVKRFDVPSMRSLIQGEQAVMGYEAVLASDYDALAAEAQALREEVAALRARVVVSPDFDNDVIIETFRRNGFQIELGASYSVKGQIAQLLNALEELARLNSLTVSESALDTLRRFATGNVKHMNNGLCPDCLEGHEARDPDCPVCRALLDTESDNV